MHKYVTTQEELDQAIADGHLIRIDNDNTYNIKGYCYVEVKNKAKPTLNLLGNFKPTIYADDASSPTINIRDSSEAVIAAWDNSTLTVNALDNSSPLIETALKAKLYLKLGGNSRVTLGRFGDIHPSIEGLPDNDARIRGDSTAVELVGGKVQFVKDVADWCKFYNVKVFDGIALLAKIVQQNYLSERVNPYTRLPVNYTPGTTPEAEDWDGGEQECGLGLHFSPNHNMAQGFAAPGKNLICPVALSDMAIHLEGEYPEKCKAKCICEPLWELDEEGNPVDDTNKEYRDAFFRKHGGQQ